MQEATVSLLTTWTNFYVIIGSAAAALTGLMFVVITLVTNAALPRSSVSFAAFGTPTVVHFCVALLVAAVLSAPWDALWYAGILLGLIGLGGVGYVMVVTRRAKRQTVYKPVLEDWLWHTAFPLVSYLLYLAASFMFQISPVPMLFGVGGATVLLVFIGIHNSWDTITYVTYMQRGPDEQSRE